MYLQLRTANWSEHANDGSNKKKNSKYELVFVFATTYLFRLFDRYHKVPPVSTRILP